MGAMMVRPTNPIEVKRKKAQQSALLDAQEIGVVNAEQSIDLQEIVVTLNEQLAEKEQQILDLQEIIVGISENGGV